MGNAIGDHLNGQTFGSSNRLLTRLPVTHDPGQLERIRNPAAVCFCVTPLL